MKTKLNFLKFAVLAALFVAQPARADFDITFSTFGTSNPVFDVGGSVANSASYLSGTAYKAQLYVGADAGSLTALGTGGLALTASVGDNTGIRNFLTSAGAGFINGGTFTVTSGTLNVNSSAVYAIRVWEAAYSSYEIAAGTLGAKIGDSGAIATTLGGTIPGSPPTVVTSQANLHGAFGLSTVTAVPEPATLALGLFGAAGLFIRRRK